MEALFGGELCARAVTARRLPQTSEQRHAVEEVWLADCGVPAATKGTVPYTRQSKRKTTNAKTPFGDALSGHLAGRPGGCP